MTGLQEQIKSRKVGRNYVMNEPISYAGIARLLDKPYQTAKRKVDKNYFTVDEALKIFNTLFVANSKYEAFEYLFTDKE